MGTLTPFEDRDVIASGIEMPGAGGGLNKALRVNNDEWHHGQTVHVVIEATVRKVRHDEVKDTQALERIHVLAVQNAAVVESDLVADLLEAQRRKVEEAQGVHALQYTDEADDVDDVDDGPEGDAPDNVTQLG